MEKQAVVYLYSPPGDVIEYSGLFDSRTARARDARV